VGRPRGYLDAEILRSLTTGLTTEDTEDTEDTESTESTEEKLNLVFESLNYLRYLPNYPVTLFQIPVSS
jgi:hypothetical protein